MATKAFYKAKKDHMRPYRDIYQRGIRALARNVPIGRGRPFELPRRETDRRKRLPDWSNEPWTKDIVRAIQNNRPYGPGVYQNPSNLRKVEDPHEKYLSKFLARHPQVSWKVPRNTLDMQEWAPIQFAKRWEELVRKENLSEEEAYMAVVNEGGGGGDWNGVWPTLEHDRLKNIIKLQAPHLERFKRKDFGQSLLNAYKVAKLHEMQMNVIYQKKVPTVNKLLDKITKEAAKENMFGDMTDLGVVLKNRLMRKHRIAVLRDEELQTIKSKTPP